MRNAKALGGGGVGRGHRLCFRNKARRKLPRNLAWPQWLLVEKY